MAKSGAAKQREAVAAGGVYVKDVNSPKFETPPNQSQFGQAKTFRVPWTEGEVRPLVTKDAEKILRELPWTKNLTLGVNVDQIQGGQFSLYWQIRVGVGGGSDVFELDAAPLQQISLSADLMQVALVPRRQGVSNIATFNYVSPTKPIRATAFLTKGATATTRPTFTQQFLVGPASALSLPIPKFAAAFRVLGVPTAAAATSPFAAARNYNLLDFTGTAIDSYNGVFVGTNRLTPIDVGIFNTLFLDNTADAVNSNVGAIAWELDL